MTRRLLFALIVAAALWLDPLWLPLVPVALFMPFFGTSCTIFSDDFTTDRTGTDYTTVSGSWSVSGGVLTTTSAAPIIIENTVGSTGHGHAKASVKGSAAGNKLQVIGAYSDSSNYIYAQLTISGSSSVLDLVQVSSGSPTTLATSATFTTSTGTFYTLEVCWNGTTATACCSATDSYGLSASCSATGNQIGLGASLSSGTATFDDFTFFKHHDDDNSCLTCCTGDSTVCCTGAILPSSTTFNLSFSGPGSDCPDLATFTDITMSAVTHSGASWAYQASVSFTAICGRGISSIEVWCQSGTPGHVYMTFNGFATDQIELTVVSCTPLHVSFSGSASTAGLWTDFQCATYGCTTVPTINIDMTA